MTRMLLLDFIHEIGCNLLYGGQKMVIINKKQIHLEFTGNEYWRIWRHKLNNYVLI